MDDAKAIRDVARVGNAGIFKNTTNARFSELKNTQPELESSPFVDMRLI